MDAEAIIAPLLVPALLYATSYTRSLRESIIGYRTMRSMVFMTLLFGLLSVLGYDGASGVAPLVGGILGGPLVGLGSGAIGGVYAMLQGGEAYIPETVYPIVAGYVGAFAASRLDAPMPVVWAAVIGAATEAVHRIVLLPFSEPSFDAIVLVAVSAVAMALFAVVLRARLWPERERIFGEIEDFVRRHGGA